MQNKYFQLSVSSFPNSCNLTTLGKLVIDKNNKTDYKALDNEYQVKNKYTGEEFKTDILNYLNKGFADFSSVKEVPKILFLLNGKMKKNCLALSSGGDIFILHDTVYDFLNQIGLSNKYNIINACVVNKKNEIISGFTKVLIVKDRYNYEIKDRKIELDFNPNEISDDSIFSYLGSVGVIVNSEIKNKMKEKFPEQFVFYPLPGDFTK